MSNIILLFLYLRLFPSLSHIIYLDVDTIVLHDISELWNEVVTSDKLFVVIQRYTYCIYIIHIVIIVKLAFLDQVQITNFISTN